MRKKNKLYTANKWNQPLFMPEKNVFKTGGTQPVRSIADIVRGAVNVGNIIANKGTGLNGKSFESPSYGIEGGKQGVDVSPSSGGLGDLFKTGIGAAGSAIGGLGSSLIGGGYSTGGVGEGITTIGGTIGSALGAVPGIGTLAGGLISAGSGLIGGLANRAFGVKTDTKKLNQANQNIDYLSGFNSNAGSYDGIITPEAVGLVKGVYDNGWLTNKADTKNETIERRQRDLLSQAQRSVDNNVHNIASDQMGDFLYNYSAFGGPLGQTGESFGTENNDGMGAINYGFMSDYLTMKQRQADAKNKMSGISPMTGFTNGFAEGGNIHIKPSHRGRLTELKARTGKSEAELYNDGNPAHKKMVVFARNARKWKHGDGGLLVGEPQDTLFALGGDIQSHGGDFSTGLTFINAGGSHEMNPYEGVQVGVDNEGTPNLVEEGETIYNDYVYSDRIQCDDATKKMFHIGKKKDITYAELSKKLEKEASERPNDPISQAGLEKQMQDLAEQQERQKQEMEAERVRAAFEALSPEEKAALMQQISARQNPAAQSQQMAQGQGDPNANALGTVADGTVSPMGEPQGAVERQAGMMQAQAGGDSMGEPLNAMNACGGKINRYDKGGEMKKKIFKLLNIHTQEDFDAWAKDNGIKAEDIDWEKPNANAAFVKALSKDSPALAHALANNYDFGAYQPDLTKGVTFDDDRGNWDAQTVQGWWGSTDPAWAQVLEAHPELTQDTHLTREELADYLRNTDAFKRGTQWLQDSPENRLAYLQRIINNPNAPAKAIAYAKKFADKDGWLPDAATDYETIFNNPSGRAANPGTYWKTPIEVARGNEARNWVIDEDGTVKEIVGDVPEDWTAAGNYSWATPENDYVYNYYTRGNDQVVTPEGKPQDTVTTSEEELEPVPVYKNGNLRYAGLLGPAVGLELMTAGVGRPDNSYWDEAVSSIGSPVLAGYKTAGNYMTYKPDDPWFYTSPILANSGAADRSILNSGVNQGTKNAGIVANGYNTNLTLGQATRQALEHNYEKDLRRTTHNTGVEQFNAQAFNQNQQFNAEALNGFRRMAGQMRMQAASEKAQGDQGWYNSLYGNVGSFFKGLSDLGRENEQHNMIAEMAADGLFGTMSPNTNVGKRGKYLTWRKKQV